MGLFHKKKKSTWEKLTEPIANGIPRSVAKPGLTALGTFVAVSFASAAVSAFRQRNEHR